MTYKLNPEVRKIISPIVLTFSDGAGEQSFSNGAALADALFQKRYCIETISAKEEHVVVTVKENVTVNTANWIGEEAVKPSFF